MSSVTIKNPDVFQFDSALSFLKAVLEYRKRKNKSYSIRSFCINADIASSTLTDYLNKKSKISLESELKLIEAFKLNREEENYYSLLVKLERLKGSKYRELIKSHVDQLSSIGWRDSRRELDGIINSLEPAQEFKYVMPNTLTFRVLVFLKNKKTKEISSHFIDRYMSSDFEVACTAYFLKNDDDTYRCYLKRGFLETSQLEVVLPNNIEVHFSNTGFPDIKNLTLTTLNSELLVHGGISFTDAHAHVYGERFNSQNPEVTLEIVDDLYLRLND
jgi:transcriptional regulator with XRE-family HTH domain